MIHRSGKRTAGVRLITEKCAEDLFGGRFALGSHGFYFSVGKTLGCINYRIMHVKFN